MSGHLLASFLAPLLAGLWLLSRPHVGQALTVAAATGTATATVVTGRARRHGQRRSPAGPCSAPRISLPGSFDGVPAATHALDRRAGRAGVRAQGSPNHPACRFYVEQGIHQLEQLLSEQAEH
jgi:hypothetical protein